MFREAKARKGLPVWVKQNRNIRDTDIVAWYTMAFISAAARGLAADADDVA